MAPVSKTPAHGPGYRRGILFTLSVLMLGTGLITLAFFLSTQSAKSTSTAAGLDGIDRTTAAYNNLQDEMARILSPSITIGVQNGTASFNYTLPVSTNISSDLDNFALFEGNFSDQNITMNLTQLKNSSLLIQPVGAVIASNSTTFSISPPNATFVRSYDVELVFLPQGVDQTQWIAISNSSASNMSVHVQVHDQQYVFLTDYYYSLDTGGTSTLNISKSGVPVGQIVFSSPGALSISTGGAIDLKTSVGFSTPVDVETNDVLSVKSTANKTGNIKIG